MQSSTGMPPTAPPAPATVAPGSSAPSAPRPPRRPIPLRRKSRAWLIAVLVVGGIVVVIGGLWLLGRLMMPRGPTALPTEVVAVTRGRVEKSVESSGKVVANLEVDIKCRASGEIVTLPFDISQKVAAGALLCQLDPTDEKLAVRSAEAAVAQSTAKLAQAEQDLKLAQENLATTRRRDESAVASARVKAINLRAKADRQTELVRQQLGSREELESAETDAAAAEAALQSAQIAIDELKQQEIQIEYKGEAVKMARAQLQADGVTLDVQKQQLAHTTVTAPVDGVVSALNVQRGTIVASGMSGFSGGTTIMTLADLSRIFIVATVDESDFGAVRVGQKARVAVASFPGQTFAGEVVRIATKGVNSSNVVTFEVKVEVLDERKNLLRPEMTGNVTIIQDERADVLTLPSSAVVRQGNETFVTAADGRKRPVKLGLQGGDTVEVVSGVADGERVSVIPTELPTRWKSQDNRPGGGPPPQ